MLPEQVESARQDTRARLRLRNLAGTLDHTLQNIDRLRPALRLFRLTQCGVTVVAHLHLCSHDGANNATINNELICFCIE
jgi:hypothetical protein